MTVIIHPPCPPCRTLGCSELRYPEDDYCGRCQARRIAKTLIGDFREGLGLKPLIRDHKPPTEALR